MHSGNDKERFKGEKEWDERNKGPGGGIVTYAKGARYDDHSDTARKLMEIEKRRQSEQKNNPGSSMKR